VSGAVLFVPEVLMTLVKNSLGKTKAVARRVLRPLLEGVDRLRWASLYTPLHNNLDPDQHIREAAQWLVRAQDSGNDRGVAYGARFGGPLEPSYPETTGYIICTFLDMANFYDEPEYLRRAVEMGVWEAEIQMASGAVMSGKLNPDPKPAVFNTGQVLLGWADLYRKTKDDRFLHAGNRAADWLISMQEKNGDWVRGNSIYSIPGGTTYNVKAAWGLAEFGQAVGRNDAVQAATRHAEFTLTRQTSNGWFEGCCLTDVERPLLHTVAYTIQGLIGMGKLVGRQDFIAAGAKTADALLKLMSPDGFIPGRIDRSMTGAVNWCCLTGSAQTSGVWSELFLLTKKNEYREGVSRVNRYLMARHDISSPDPAIRGGVPGSWPVWEEYGRLKNLNWATKFFLDALLLEKRISKV